MDKGLCIVLTVVTGAVLFAAEACTNQTEHPPATETLTNQPVEESGQNTAPTGNGSAGSTSGAGGGGDGTTDPNPAPTTSPTQPGSTSGTSGQTTPTQPGSSSGQTTPTQPGTGTSTSSSSG